MPFHDPPVTTLRQILRNATAAEHDRLDDSVDGIELADADRYRRFLSMQLMAREPIEEWLEGQDLPLPAPPPQAALIAADLADLGGSLSPMPAPFDPPAGSDPIGACWAIAGSSLGNRAMYQSLSRADRADALPKRFLADGAMTEYWKSLKPLLEAPAGGDTAPAVASAKAVFAAFLSASYSCQGKLA